MSRPVQVRLVTVLRLCQQARVGARARGAARVVQCREDAVGELLGRRSGQDGGVVVEDLRMRQQARRDDRLAGAQVLIDLQGRVGTARARRDEHVGGEQVGRNLRGRLLASKDRHAFHAGLGRHFACERDLIGFAADEHQPSIRTRARDDRHRVE